MHASASDRWFSYINVALLGVVGIITFFPLYYIFVVSFTDPSEYIKGGVILFPEQWSLASYKYLLSTNAFIRAIGNTSFLAIVGTFLSLLVTAGLSYAISRRRLLGRRAIMLLLLLTTLFNPGIIPRKSVV